jgi:peptidylprolyl isomerase
VPSQKRDRQWVSSRAKAAAAEAARRRQNRKRLGAALGLGVLVIAIVGAAAFTGGGSSSSTTTTDPNASLVDPSLSTTTEAPLPSAAGKPCVAVSDPLPAGAPDVPVKVGPPPTDLVIEDLRPGDGAVVAEANTLSVNYIGVSCSTGKIFDSSYTRGQPASFQLSGVITGWTKGLPGMKVGGQRLLGIPPAMAYGSNPPPSIAPDETLWFVVDVLSAT